MKKVFLILIIINLYSCSSVKKRNVIPYILSIDAENSIYQKIKNQNKEEVEFYFERLSENKNKIHLRVNKSNEKDEISNRKLFINDCFYPLIFDLDYLFYVKLKNNYPIVSIFEDEKELKSNEIKMPSIEERVKNKMLYIKDAKKYIIDFSIYWLVDNNGNLLETNSK